MADLSGGTRGHNNAFARSRRHYCSGISHRGAIRDTSILGYLSHVLLSRDGFAGERGFINLQIVFREDAQISRHPIA